VVGDVWLTAALCGPWYSRLLGWAQTFLRPGMKTWPRHVMIEVGEKDGVPLLLSAEIGGASLVLSTFYTKGHRFSVRRKVDLTKHEREMLYNAALKLKGAPYSEGTFIAHLFGWRVARFFARLNRKDVICSELVADIYDSIGYRFRKRHSTKRLPPAAVRPRDIEFDTRDAPWIVAMEINVPPLN